MSKSKEEEIITALWAIVWAVLYTGNAPNWLVWVFGIKALLDFACVVGFSIIEIRKGDKS